MRVLLVEDEKSLAAALAKILENKKIMTDVANDGLEGKLLADNDIYDVIILDIMLPEINGLEILKYIREEKGSNVPILLLTAKDRTEDKVLGLNMGADDYLVKPFVTDELVARIQALGRRPRTIFHSNEIQYANLLLKINSGELYIDGELNRLTAKESHLMEMFMRNADNIISKEQILDRIWGIDSQAMENSVEIYIHYIRKKLKNGGATAYIKTVRGLGYALKEKKGDEA
jgi:DNA-binding response OmpR family regulator